jgi:CheY-like chemotaxis protein
MRKIDAIAIIDDDPITVYGIRKMLGLLDRGSQILAYENGKLALEGLKQRFLEGQAQPEIIFLDLNMPIMDGWQFLEAFLALPLRETVRINIVTSSIDPKDLNLYQEFKQKTCHLIDFRHKPIRRSDLEEITHPAG